MRFNTSAVEKYEYILKLNKYEKVKFNWTNFALIRGVCRL